MAFPIRLKQGRAYDLCLVGQALEGSAERFGRVCPAAGLEKE